MFAAFAAAFVYSHIQIGRGQMKEIEHLVPLGGVEIESPVEGIEKSDTVKESIEIVKTDVTNSVTVKAELTEKPVRENNFELLVDYMNQFISYSNALDYTRLVYKYGELNAIEPTWLVAIMETESFFNARAVSSEGATGLMQILPSTASYLGEYDVSNLFDPETNIRLSAKYLAELQSWTGSLEMAIIAYNQGIGNVQRGTYKTWYYKKVKSNYSKIKSSSR